MNGGGVLITDVCSIAERMGLECIQQFRMGKRIWGAERKIDVLLTEPVENNRLGIECMYQSVSGTAEWKIFATGEDMKVWPIPGVVVLGGGGFGEHMYRYMISSGRAIALEDLDMWLKLFFNLDFDK